MLTDDDLTRELAAAFRAATTDLTYTGRTRPPRRAAAVLPATAGTVAVAAVVAGAIITGGHPHPASGPVAVGPTATGPAAASSTAGPAAGHASAASPTPVTETLTLAGFTITYQRIAGQPDPVVAELVVGGLPAGVREVHLTGTKSRAWVGQDPRSGDNALYLRASTRNGGRLFALLSATWSEKQLIGLVAHPRAVPLVSPGRSGSPG
jgi:hypothetical protein